MERRDFLKTVTAGGATALLASGFPLMANAVAAEAQSAGIAGSESARALDEFLALVADVHNRYLSAEYGNSAFEDQVTGRRFLAHVMHAALRYQLEANPLHPRWVKFVDPQLKLLGDNPDAVYFNAPVDPKHRYRIRGNTSKADYTSFTVEAGTANGGISTRLLATLNDTQFDINPDGSYELIAGGPRLEKNWLDLGSEAGSITTRHYFEWERSAAADPTLNIPLTIEALDVTEPPSPPDDAAVAASWRRVANFFRAVTLGMNMNDLSKMPPFVSREVNRFAPPNQKIGNRAVGFGAADNVYLMTNYELAADEALVMRGRFPKCRFANVVLFNRFGQTYDYANRRISLNRRQTKYEADNSFRMVLANRDPGVPNWLDTEGHKKGQIFWRFQLAEETIQPIETELVKLNSL